MYVHACISLQSGMLVLFTLTASFYLLKAICVWSLCGTYCCCLSCALQSTTFLQPLTEKPQSNRGVYFGASTGPRLVHMKKVRTYVRMYSVHVTWCLSLSYAYRHMYLGHKHTLMQSIVT